MTAHVIYELYYKHPESFLNNPQNPQKVNNCEDCEKNKSIYSTLLISLHL